MRVIVKAMCETEFDMEDDATDEEMKDAAQNDMWNLVEWNWERVEDERNDE